MIITDSSQPFPPKNTGSTSTLPTVTPPPPYIPVPLPKATDRYPLYAPPASHYAGPRARKRFLLAFIWSALLCTLFGITSRGVAHIAGTHFGRSGWDMSEDGWPIPPEYNTTECFNGGGWRRLGTSGMGFPFSAEVSFELPLASDHLFLVSRGAQSSGQAHISTTPSDSDQIKVDVTMHYRTQDALRLAGACLLTRRHDEHGVGVFTPSHWERRGSNYLYFNVVVHLPTGGASPLVIDAFSTDLHNFGIQLGDLDNSVEFRSLDLRTTNGAVIAGSLNAEDAKITTSNGPIHGSFKTSTTLALTSTNGGVKADISLFNDNTLPTALNIQTSNGAVDTSISQYSKSETGGRFRTSVQTSNSGLTLDIPVSPLGATVQLSGVTSNGPARISLPASYEGAFALSTSTYTHTNLDRVRGVEDPSGEERRRGVNENVHGRGRLEGKVRWVPAGEGADSSWVRVRTSNSMATLRL